MSGKTNTQILQCLEKRLSDVGNGNPKRVVEELAAHVLGCRPLEIYFKQITSWQETELEALVARAEQGEPIQYIIGHVDFRGLEIACDPRALIPRPETELLVDAVLENVDATSSSRHIRKERGEDTASTLKIADVCTGTGCIGLALAHELPNAKVTAIDISPDALELAKENAGRLGIRFQCLENNLLEGLDDASFDVVVSNPPYIFSNVCKTLNASVREHEPMLALDGGGEGMDLIVPLVQQAAWVLKPGGSLFIEIGYDQGQAVFQCLETAGFKNVRIVKDLAVHDRIVCGEKSL